MPKKSRSLLSRPDRYERPAVWFRAPRARKYYLFGFVERLTVAEAPAILRLIEAGRLYAAADMSGPNEPVPDDLGVISRYIFPRLQCFEHGLASLQRMKDNPDFWARLLNKRWLRLWPESAALCYHMPDDFSFELFGHVLCDVSSESEVVVIHGVGLVMFIEGNSVCGTIRRCIADRMVFYLLPEDAAAAESPHTEGISSFLSEWFDETVPENARGSNPQPSEIVFANVSCDEATIKGLLKRQMEKNRLWKAWGGKLVVHQRGEESLELLGYPITIKDVMYGESLLDSRTPGNPDMSS
ncbi:hypothetical protein IAT38_005952 [Cryptococcus sp. DSM 104549]